MPLLNETWARNAALPSAWMNALEGFVSSASHNFAVTAVPGQPAQVQVAASAGDGLVAIAIKGLWRWVEATVTRAHPGGAAGAYDIYVTAANDAWSNTPNPWTDNTNRAFALAIVASGQTPTIQAGVVDVYRKVAMCQWDGAATISQIVNLIGPSSGAAPHHATHEPGGSDAINLDNVLRFGTHAQRPTATAALEGVYYYETDTNGGTIFQCQGAAWAQITKGVNAQPTGAAGGDTGGSYPNPTVLQSTGQAWPGNAGWQYMKLVGAAALLWDTGSGGVILRSNYDPATDRLVVNTNASWQLRLRSSTDSAILSRAPATAGSPAYVDLVSIANDGSATGLLIADANVKAAAAIQESKLALATDAAAATGSRRTVGTGALQAMSGADARVAGPWDKDDLLQQGCVGSGSLAVSGTLTAGSVIAVAAGTIWLPDANGLLQRHIAVTNANAASIAAAPASGHSRIDTLFATYAGAGLPPTYQYLQGTDQPVLTTNEVNRSGAVAPPAQSVAIADYTLVNTAGVVTVKMFDRRPWARGFSMGTSVTAGNYSTSSASMVAADTTRLQFRVEVGASGLLRATLSAIGHNNTAGTGIATGLIIDGTATGILGYATSSSANFDGSCGFSVPLSLAQGTHLIVVAFEAVNGGTVTLQAATNPLYFELEEKRPSVSNGTA